MSLYAKKNKKIKHFHLSGNFYRWERKKQEQETTL